MVCPVLVPGGKLSVLKGWDKQSRAVPTRCCKQVAAASHPVFQSNIEVFKRARAARPEKHWV